MQKYTERKTFRFTKQQIETFEKLEQKGYDISDFVRLAIKEKIQRDKIKVKVENQLSLVKVKKKYF